MSSSLWFRFHRFYIFGLLRTKLNLLDFFYTIKVFP
jgi:hypothetical protein